MKRPVSIIFLQGIIFLALIISISLHKIITVFEYFKDSTGNLTSYGLAGIQFALILFFLFLSYGLWKRKSYAQGVSIIFFAMILIGFNIFGIILGDAAINIIKFTAINGICVFFVLQLSFNKDIRQFFRLKNSRPASQRRLKNNMFFDDN